MPFRGPRARTFLGEPIRTGAPLPGSLPHNGRSPALRRMSFGEPRRRVFNVHVEKRQPERVTTDAETLIVLTKRERRSIRRRGRHHSARQERKRLHALRLAIRAKAREEAAKKG